MDLSIKLTQTYEQTLPHFELEDEKLLLSYGPGKWNIRELLHHIVDAETVMYDRIRRTLSKPGQVIWGFDQNAWVSGLGYTDRPLALSKQMYMAVRANVQYLVEQHYPQASNFTFVHSETGMRTLKDEFDKVAWHNAHHLSQIEQALAG